MAENKKKLVSDEELQKVSGGALLKSDKEWVDEQLWPFIEGGKSWNDVVDRLFPTVLEEYCNKVNSTPERSPSHMNVTPKELDDYMIVRFFDLGDAWFKNGCRRPRKEDLPITVIPH